MATVRFATTCDQCMNQTRSAEYTAFPTCRECGAHVCPDHEMPNERRDETDETNQSLCKDCGGFVIE